MNLSSSTDISRAFNQKCGNTTTEKLTVCPRFSTHRNLIIGEAVHRDDYHIGCFLTSPSVRTAQRNSNSGRVDKRDDGSVVENAACFTLYGSIMQEGVWDKTSGHTCRASVSSSPLLTGLFGGIQLVVGTYIKLFLVCSPRLGFPVLPFPLVVIPWVRSRMLPSVYFVQRVRTR